jgi:tetratricopeptide (TPR) repeat protein
MLKPKRKMTKQDLKEDKFVKYSLQAKTYIDENYQKIMRAVIGASILIVIAVFYYYNSIETDKEANSQLGIAEIEFANANLVKASQRLVKLIEEYDGTDAADQGMFLLANIYFQQKNYTDARWYFEKFVSAYSGSNILLASGYAGIAACSEVEENYQDAAELYERAADLAPQFPESDNYYYLSALCYKKAGDLDKAKALFEHLAEEAKTTNRVRDAETQLVLLKNNK